MKFPYCNRSNSWKRISEWQQQGFVHNVPNVTKEEGGTGKGEEAGSAKGGGVWFTVTWPLT